MIVSERVKKLAADLSVAKRLGAGPEAAHPENLRRYMALLGAVDQVAGAIAEKNAREAPSDADYHAAFAAFCIWPPNKPPLAEPFWEDAISAVGHEKGRQALRASVGPLAAELPSKIAAGQGEKTVLTQWPADQADYFSRVLNLQRLSDLK